MEDFYSYYKLAWVIYIKHEEKQIKKLKDKSL